AIYLAVTPTRYTASSLLLFDVRQTQPFQQQSYPNPVTDSAYVDSQLEVLKSESIATSVIRNLNLLAAPEFVRQDTGILNAPRRILDSVLGGGGGSPELTQWSYAISVFQSNLEVKRVGLTYVVQVGYRSHDAGKAARISNAVTQAYIIAQLASKY